MKLWKEFQADFDSEGNHNLHMEKENGPQDPSEDDIQLPEHISELIEPALDEIERRERSAEQIGDELRTALQRQEELRRAATKDPSFEDDYEAATRRVRELDIEFQQGADTPPDNPSDSE